MKGSIIGLKPGVATTEQAGLIKPDGLTISVDQDGTMHVNGGGGDLALDDVTGATATVTREVVSLTWTDPNNKVIEGTTVAEWAGTKVVKKVGSAPVDQFDGVVIADVTTKNQYSADPLTDSSVQYDTTYYYRFFPYTTRGTITNGSSVTATPTREVIYLPTWSETLTYNGTAQTATFTGYDSSKMTGSGMTQTNAGSYNASFTPNHDYMWSDSTASAKTVAWSIGQAAASATFTSSGDPVTEIEFDPDNLSQSIVVTATGSITSATSSDTTVATISGSGTNYTISSVDDTSGTATITFAISASQDGNYASGSVTLGVTAAFVQIYGAEWDGTSTTAWTRTDAAANFADPNPYYAGMSGSPSSPFDNIMPWSGIRIVEDDSAGTLVEIPKFYYKWTRNEDAMKLQICMNQEEGFLCSPAHADRGDNVGERDYVYIGRYHCSDYDYKSTSGVLPKVSITRSTARSSIHNLGTNIWQMDFAMWWTINILYLVEFADWNSQAMIGYGCGNNSSTENSGASDSMPYHTGTMQTSRTTYGVGCQYRYIEDWWGNVRDLCDGIYFSGSNNVDIYCIKNPANFSDSTGGTYVGTRNTVSSGYIKAWNTPSADGFEYALYPSDHSASEGTYVCDSCSYYSLGVVLSVGGNYNRNQYSGAFWLNGNGFVSNSSVSIGCRLMVLPSSRLT